MAGWRTGADDDGSADPVVTPEVFAMSIVDDYQLPLSYQNTITKAIQEQLSDYQAHTSGGANDREEDRDRDGDGDGEKDVVAGEGVLAADDGSGKWWEAWRKRVRTKAGFAKSGAKDKDRDGGARKPKRRKIAVGEEAMEMDGMEADVEPEAETEVEGPMDVHEIFVDHKRMPEEMRIVIKVSE
jgi:SWI/SNF-related matrix-associated actin-dependent regulator of chromatin subfamily B member 1